MIKSHTTVVSKNGTVLTGPNMYAMETREKNKNFGYVMLQTFDVFTVPQELLKEALRSQVCGCHTDL